MKENELTKYNLCIEAIKFRNKYNSFEEAWNNCHRGDWMLFIAYKLKVNNKKLVLTKGYCAQTVIHLMTDKRSINAVNTAIKFGKGEASKEELKNAASAAKAAVTVAFTAAFTAVKVASDAKTNAKTATYYATYSAYSSAAKATYSAVKVASNAADAAKTATYSDSDARTKNQLETANICKRHLTKEVFKLINKK